MHAFVTRTGCNSFNRNSTTGIGAQVEHRLATTLFHRESIVPAPDEKTKVKEQDILVTRDARRRGLPLRIQSVTLSIGERSRAREKSSPGRDDPRIFVLSNPEPAWRPYIEQARRSSEFFIFYSPRLRINKSPRRAAREGHWWMLTHLQNRTFTGSYFVTRETRCLQTRDGE